MGVVAAQSIGEPGTQLTVRTFHIGGTASRISDQNTLNARHAGTAHYEGMVVVETHKEGGQPIVMNRNGSVVVKDEKGRDRERYPIVYGARLKVKDGQKVEVGQTLVEWDPYTFSILTEASISGKIDHLRGLKENVTMGRLGHRSASREGGSRCSDVRQPATWSSYTGIRGSGFGIRDPDSG